MKKPIFILNPLRIETTSTSGEKISVSLGGNWLQYCDRRDSHIEVSLHNDTAGWILESNCHNNIDNIDKVSKVNVFMSKSNIERAAEHIFNNLIVNYEPSKSLLKIENQ